ncbi:MAG: glycerophosphodiester phosphodiesterase [Chlamydiota bacterium]
MKIIAHRGASIDAPENSLEAICQAIKHQVDYVEFDVQLTRDAIPIVLHDTIIEDPAHSAQWRLVRDLQFEEIGKLDVGKQFLDKFEGMRIPTLEEVLALETGKTGYFIEIKSAKPYAQADVACIVDLLERVSCPKKVVIGSLNPAVVIELSRLASSFSVIGIAASEGDIRAFLNQKLKLLAIQQQHLSAHTIKWLHKLGFEVWGWVIDDPYRAEEVASYGLDGVITNNVCRFASYFCDTLNTLKRMSF